MANTLSSPRVQDMLSHLFAAAEHDQDTVPALMRALAHPVASPAERSQALRDAYLPISAQAGNLLYALVRAIRPQTVVEFGTSYGISTIYLAAAVTDNATGHLITTELSTKKAIAAQANLRDAGVSDAVTVLAGDALDTLADIKGPVGLAFLDGWKDLCLPVLSLIEPVLTPGALIAADDNTHPGMAHYLGYVRNPANGYVTVSFPVEDGVEISSWTGHPGTSLPLGPAG